MAHGSSTASRNLPPMAKWRGRHFVTDQEYTREELNELFQLAVALKAFPATAWVVRHPRDWPAGELEQANQWLQAHGIADARFEHDQGLEAGIRIVCGMNLLDSSPDGLLADRAQIEGRLLHYLEQAP